MKTIITTEQKKEACYIVESMARAIGPQCEVVFAEFGVQVALLSDAGDTTAPDLFTALVEAKEGR